MTVYLTVGQVIAYNAKVGGRGAGLRDLAVLEGALSRASAGFGDMEVFPSLWQKAAALLHGIATTQAFSDGNKRTAWTVCESFLGLNGIDLGDIDVLETEAVVRAAAAKRLDIPAIAEWLHRAAVKASAESPARPGRPRRWAALIGTAAGAAAVGFVLASLPRGGRGGRRQARRAR